MAAVRIRTERGGQIAFRPGLCERAGFRLDKHGKPVRSQGRKSVSKRIAERKSKKVRVVAAK